jgi:predicted dienelactone hydrolase
MLKYIFILSLFFISELVSASEKIGVQTVSFFDSRRKRPLIVEVLYPADPSAKAKPIDDVWKNPPVGRDALIKKQGKLPLILFSHGDGGSRLDNQWFAAELVKAGYIVASVDHYGNTWYLNLPKESLKRWNRAEDISFVLQELLSDSQFSSFIDPNRIGFTGFSLGGLTGIWLIGGKANLFRTPKQNSSHYTELALRSDQETIDSIDYSPAKASYYEPRIKSAFLMAPAYGFAFDFKGLQSIRTPVSIVAGEADSVVPVNENAKHFAKEIPGCKLNILKGKVGHFVFLNEPSETGKKVLQKNLAQDDPSVSRAEIHQKVSHLATEFFDKTLK